MTRFLKSWIWGKKKKKNLFTKQMIITFYSRMEKPNIFEKIKFFLPKTHPTSSVKKGVAFFKFS